LKCAKKIEEEDSMLKIFRAGGFSKEWSVTPIGVAAAALIRVLLYY
jgi:hypothetical protein